jgi:hypothetical protein
MKKQRSEQEKLFISGGSFATVGLIVLLLSGELGSLLSGYGGFNFEKSEAIFKLIAFGSLMIGFFRISTFFFLVKRTRKSERLSSSREIRQ